MSETASEHRKPRRPPVFDSEREEIMHIFQNKTYSRLFCLLIFIWPTQGISEEMAHITSKDLGITLSYPAKWHVFTDEMQKESWVNQDLYYLIALSPNYPSYRKSIACSVVKIKKNAPDGIAYILKNDAKKDAKPKSHVFRAGKIKWYWSRYNDQVPRTYMTVRKNHYIGCSQAHELTDYHMLEKFLHGFRYVK